MIFKWIKRIKDYYKEKELAEKCGMVYSDFCQHESNDPGELLEGKWRMLYTCTKCGEKFYQ
jgi:hypothetical protein